jgi:hypothetical protein
MTRYAPLWQQNSSYPASVDRGLISTLWPASGVAGGAPSLVANTLNVQVAPGAAAVALSSAANLSELCRWDAAESVTLAAGPAAGNTRIDLVVLQVRDQVLDAGANNDFLFVAVTGVPSTGVPAVPAVPTNAYAICQVTVPAQAANLNAATLVDLRATLGVTVPSVRTAVYRAAAFTTVPGPSPALYDTATEGGQWYSAGSGLFTCPIAGRYLVVAKIGAISSAANQFYRGHLWRNGAVAKSGPYFVVAAASLQLDGYISASIRCAAGDTLAAAFNCSTGGLTGVAGSDQSWANFEYLGA